MIMEIRKMGTKYRSYNGLAISSAYRPQGAKSKCLATRCLIISSLIGFVRSNVAATGDLAHSRLTVAKSFNDQHDYYVRLGKVMQG